MFVKQTQDEFILIRKGPDYVGLEIESFDDPLKLAQHAIRFYAWKRCGGEELHKFLEGELRALEEE
jgi:hypothetical protein